MSIASGSGYLVQRMQHRPHRRSGFDAGVLRDGQGRDPHELYFRGDGHSTPAGHKLAAQALGAYPCATMKSSGE